MPFDYAECRLILHKGLVDSLDFAADKIRSLAAAERMPWMGTETLCGIDGISYDILPWHNFVAISIRIRDDEPEEMRYRYSPADWKYYEFLGNENMLDQVREYINRAYQSAGDPSHKKEAMHLINLAAADALLESGISKRLQSFGIDATGIDNPQRGDQFPKGWFEYMVIDEDRVIKANYSEIVIANRITRRLLGTTV